MGADLMLTYVPVPQWRWYEPAQVAGLNRVKSKEVVNIWDWAKQEVGKPLPLTEEGALIRAAVQARIAALTDEQITDAWADATGGDVEDMTEDPRAYLLECFDAVTIGGRDIALMRVEDRQYYFTGGMSWGDNPTDAYDKVNLLGCAVLLDKPFGFDPSDPHPSQPVNA